jgi:anti-sigma B factor antagonist
MIQIEHQEDVLNLIGALTIYQALKAKEAIQEELGKGPVRRVDLAGLEEIDTAGVQVLLWLKEMGRPQDLRFTQAGPPVLEVLGQLNLGGAFGGSLLTTRTS